MSLLWIIIFSDLKSLGVTSFWVDAFRSDHNQLSTFKKIPPLNEIRGLSKSHQNAETDFLTDGWCFIIINVIINVKIHQQMIISHFIEEHTLKWLISFFSDFRASVSLCWRGVVDASADWLIWSNPHDLPGLPAGGELCVWWRTLEGHCVLTCCCFKATLLIMLWFLWCPEKGLLVCGVRTPTEGHEGSSSDEDGGLKGFHLKYELI